MQTDRFKTTLKAQKALRLISQARGASKKTERWLKGEANRVSGEDVQQN
jgi:hypothetical protein